MGRYVGMAAYDFHPLFAGAIFTENEVRGIVALVIVIFVATCVAFGFFVRSVFRLITRKEKSLVDVAVVVVGLLLFAPPLVSRMQTPEEPINRGEREATARQLIHEVTGRSTHDLGLARWSDFHACSFVKFDIVDAERNYRGVEHELLNNQTVKAEAQRFEDLGWEVTRYGESDPDLSAGWAFRADLDDHALMLYEWGGLGYAYLDSDCADFTGNIQTGRVEVNSFPAA